MASRMTWNKMFIASKANFWGGLDTSASKSRAIKFYVSAYSETTQRPFQVIIFYLEA